MKFLVELDHHNTGQPYTRDNATAFIEGIIFPTLARAEQLVEEGHIVAGGPVAGRIALRLVMEVESAQELDQLVSSIPLWTVADTQVTPLIEFGDRLAHIQVFLKRIA